MSLAIWVQILTFHRFTTPKKTRFIYALSTMVSGIDGLFKVICQVSALSVIHLR